MCVLYELARRGCVPAMCVLCELAQGVPAGACPDVPMCLQYGAAAPGVFIYDNACNAHRYAMKREPVYFARTWFAIDRTHQKGHTA